LVKVIVRVSPGRPAVAKPKSAGLGEAVKTGCPPWPLRSAVKETPLTIARSCAE
jgi:hypothetical protein